MSRLLAASGALMPDAGLMGFLASGSAGGRQITERG